MSFSHKSFSGRKLRNADFSGVSVIRGSGFSQEQPDTEVFPDGLAVTFINCNLDNVVIPAGCTVIDSSTRRFMAQEDGLDWLVDGNNNPIERLV